MKLQLCEAFSNRGFIAENYQEPSTTYCLVYEHAGIVHLDYCDHRETRVLQMNGIPSAFGDINMVTKSSILNYGL